MTVARDAFDEAYGRWREMPFPKGGDARFYGEIHADVALADSWVAETLLPFVNKGVVDPAVIDVLGRLSELRKKIDRLDAQTGPENHAAAAGYLAFVNALIDVYGAFLALIQPRDIR